MKRGSVWHRIKNRLAFWFGSVNQHGVHSPFVYELLTKGIQGPDPKKKHDLLTNHAFIFNHYPENLTNRILTHLYQAPPYPNVHTIYNKNVILTFQKNFSIKFLCHDSLSWTEGDLVLFPFPYENEETENQWKNIKDAAFNHVIVECYTLGMVFCRQGQYPQEFKLRVG